MSEITGRIVSPMKIKLTVDEASVFNHLIMRFKERLDMLELYGCIEEYDKLAERLAAKLLDSIELTIERN